MVGLVFSAAVEAGLDEFLQAQLFVWVERYGVGEGGRHCWRLGGVVLPGEKGGRQKWERKEDSGWLVVWGPFRES